MRHHTPPLPLISANGRHPIFEIDRYKGQGAPVPRCPLQRHSTVIPFSQAKKVFTCSFDHIVTCNRQLLKLRIQSQSMFHTNLRSGHQGISFWPLHAARPSLSPLLPRSPSFFVASAGADGDNGNEKSALLIRSFDIRWFDQCLPQRATER